MSKDNTLANTSSTYICSEVFFIEIIHCKQNTHLILHLRQIKSVFSRIRSNVCGKSLTMISIELLDSDTLVSRANVLKGRTGSRIPSLRERAVPVSLFLPTYTVSNQQQGGWDKHSACKTLSWTHRIRKTRLCTVSVARFHCFASVTQQMETPTHSLSKRS